MCIHLEARPPQGLHGETEEEPVLEHTAAQGHPVQPGLGGDAATPCHHYLGHCPVEPRRYRGDGHGVHVRDERVEEPPQPYHPVPVLLLDGEGIGRSDIGTIGRHLQLHCRLGLVVHAAPYAEHGRDAIEQPPAARRHGAVEPPLDLPLYDISLPPVYIAGKRQHRHVLAVQGVQVREGHAVGSLHGGIAAGKGDILQVPLARKAPVVGDEELPAPHSTIRAVAGAVEGNADNRPLQPVLHHAAHDVGVVVLHRDQLQALVPLHPLPGIPGGEVVRVQVTGDDLWLEAEEPLVELDGALEVLQRLQVLQVTDVLAHEGVVVLDSTERVLELGAAGEHLPARGEGEADGIGGIPPRPPHQPGRPCLAQGHAVVVAGIDIAVVDDEEVGDAPKPAQRLCVVLGNGLLAHVAAGHHQGPAHLAQQHVVERCVRQHRPQVLEAGGHRRRYRGARPPPHEHDGALRRGEQPLLLRGHQAVPPHLVHGGHHYGQGFIRAPLPLPQAPHRLVALGIARQVKAPQPLQGEHLALAQRSGGGRDDIIAADRGPLPVHELKAGATGRAGVGLGVKAAVKRVVVLPLAVGAHHEAAHGGVGAVVGDILDDGESRAAVGAVGEGVAVAAVAWREQLREAGIAGGDVGRYQLVPALLGEAVPDLEAGIAPGRGTLH